MPSDGLPKKVEVFFFYEVVNAANFRSQLIHIIPLITSFVQSQALHNQIEAGRKVSSGVLMQMSAVNMSFSHKGLVAVSYPYPVLCMAPLTQSLQLGLQSDLGDTAFVKGQLASAADTLGDDVNQWDPDFKKDIHGLILVTGDCTDSVDKKLGQIKALFKVGQKDAGIKEVTHILGHVRPGKENGHEQ